ncbi:hypothetical protein N8978_03230 [Flavobacteriaceae bacterium]|jgi:hypothetical protein|nr:hypothetical protein [Flavobacteriaceae bacterium]
MKYELGNNYGTGRPKGSKNKIHLETKELINKILFDEKQFTADWKEMDVHARMELRIKMARFIIPEPKEAPVSLVQEDYPLFVDTREDALRLLRMTEDGPEQVGGEIVFE